MYSNALETIFHEYLIKNYVINTSFFSPGHWPPGANKIGIYHIIYRLAIPGKLSMIRFDAMNNYIRIYESTKPYVKEKVCLCL